MERLTHSMGLYTSELYDGNFEKMSYSKPQII
jgi:hypothetical protein